MRYTYYDFFCGGGMAGVGLGREWSCLLANDLDPKKAAAFAANSLEGLTPRVEDVANLTPRDAPGRADLAWASFPCQDLSLAGRGAGLSGARSGAFWAFWRLMRGLRAEGRAPRIIALENVGGAATSRGGRDLAEILSAIAGDGYRVGALMLNADAFVPQSRPRLFVIGVDPRLLAARPPAARSEEPSPRHHPPAIRRALDLCGPETRAAWVWWSPAAPPPRVATLGDLVDWDRNASDWRKPKDTRKLLRQMAPRHLQKIEEAAAREQRAVGAAFRRSRGAADGGSRPHTEVRFDGVAGCVRTPGGGSSRQILLFVEGLWRASRFLRPREAARLMGLPEEWRLPRTQTEALHLIGDGVAPPVVRHLAAEILEPLLDDASAIAA